MPSLAQLSAAPARVRRRLLRHRRLLAFVLTAAAVVGVVHAVRPPPAPTTSLVVASRDLPAGATLGRADLTVERVPAAAVPAGAEADPVGRVLAGGMRRGEPFTDLRLVGPALARAVDGAGAALTAVPVRFGDAGMAGLLRVGDRVRLLTTDPSNGATRAVADEVEVLAVPRADPSEEGAATSVTNATGGRLVVVGVDDDLVTTVASAAVGGFLSFAYDH